MIVDSWWLVVWVPQVLLFIGSQVILKLNRAPPARGQSSEPRPPQGARSARTGSTPRVASTGARDRWPCAPAQHPTHLWQPSRLQPDCRQSLTGQRHILFFAGVAPCCALGRAARAAGTRPAAHALYRTFYEQASRGGGAGVRSRRGPPCDESRGRAAGSRRTNHYPFTSHCSMPRACYTRPL